MAITIGEMMALQPGDTVRVISQEEYEKNKDDYYFNYDWGIGMCDYLGRELTIRIVECGATRVCVYVDENGYYWLPEFLDCVVYSSSKMDAPSEDSLMDLLFS